MYLSVYIGNICIFNIKRGIGVTIMRILKIILLYSTLLCFILLCACNKKIDNEITISNNKKEIENKNLMRSSSQEIEFNGKLINISILEYESYEREIKIGELSIKIPAKFVDFHFYDKIIAEDLDGDNMQEIIIFLNSSGSGNPTAIIILKVQDNNIYEITLPTYEDCLGIKAELSFTNDYKAIVKTADDTLSLKLNKDLKAILYPNNELMHDISKGVDCASRVEIKKDLHGKSTINIYQLVWAPVHAQRISDLVTVIEIDNNKSKIVDVYLSE